MKSILIVEDDVLSAIYLKELLEEANYNIIGVVSKGEDAIKNAEILSPNLILMDVLLKDHISGCEAALKISKNNPNISIIFLTAHADKEMLEYAKRSNACAYLMKPYHDDEILATVYLTLHRNKYQNFENHLGRIKLKNGYSFDMQTLILGKADKHIPLTTSKSKLVEILVQNVDNVVSYNQLSNFIWGEPREPSTLRSLIYRTKQTIGEELITNVNGVGYSINSK
jgi:DNA-binding response OmpR family regulator